ncbi:MAG: hypothetical protein HY721_14770 [Planctomycetes bacterium]|nr:hypothetical protein [Planctomycetota bacterium]
MAATTFELYLLPAHGAAVEPAVVREALDGLPLRPVKEDPCRFWYRDDDTSVYFQVLLGIDLGGELAAGGEDAAASGGPLEEPPAEEDEPAPSIEAAPVTFAVPLLCPSFFAREAAEVAAKLAEKTGLAVEASAGAPGDRSPTAADLAAAWAEARRGALRELKDPEDLTAWSRAKCEAWWRYGSSRVQLEAALAPEGVRVPPLRAARYRGAARSLCAWEPAVPSVVPRSDLVLVRRDRTKKGLFLSRRVAEEGIVPGQVVWDILAPFSEIREDPAPLLVFREASRPPQQVAAELETLVLEPLEAARRTELLGVVDVEGGEAGEAVP